MGRVVLLDDVTTTWSRFASGTAEAGEESAEDGEEDDQEDDSEDSGGRAFAFSSASAVDDAAAGALAWGDVVVSVSIAVAIATIAASNDDGATTAVVGWGVAASVR